MKESKQIEIDFGNGKTSTIDENVYSFISDLQKNPRSFPPFWNLSKYIKNLSDDFLNFYSYLIKNTKVSKSQLYQDLFVLYELKEKTNGIFLEYGATNGVDLSNTYLLENKFNWKGVLSEPSNKWHLNLKKNRPNSKILHECIYSQTGKNLNFFTSYHGEFSTLEEFRYCDKSTMPGNTKDRNYKGYNHEVTSISLNDVFIKYFNSSPIDYMSVDTEGSEFIILENFDFKKYSPKIVTVEHNFTETENKLDILFTNNNYKRVLKEYTQFDAWYVLRD